MIGFVDELMDLRHPVLEMKRKYALLRRMPIISDAIIRAIVSVD